MNGIDVRESLRDWHLESINQGLQAINRRLTNMAAGLDALNQAIADLTGIVAQVLPILQSNPVEDSQVAALAAKVEAQVKLVSEALNPAPAPAAAPAAPAVSAPAAPAAS